mmetsp:Transcript_2974/g.11418  ORF Transcript_2974/g.11418 Transcript_2974/m.11418 type:complete len:269 (+) Transcript_2974:1333-2139(+)
MEHRVNSQRSRQHPAHGGDRLHQRGEVHAEGREVDLAAGRAARRRVASATRRQRRQRDCQRSHQLQAVVMQVPVRAQRARLLRATPAPAEAEAQAIRRRRELGGRPLRQEPRAPPRRPADLCAAEQAAPARLAEEVIRRPLASPASTLGGVPPKRPPVGPRTAHKMNSGAVAVDADAPQLSLRSLAKQDRENQVPSSGRPIPPLDDGGLGDFSALVPRPWVQEGLVQPTPVAREIAADAVKHLLKHDVSVHHGSGVASSPPACCKPAT